MTMKDRILDFLELEAKADEQKALATFELLFKHPAGIGDHSTGDFYDNARAALDKFVDARDRLTAISCLKGSTFGD